MGHPNAGHGPVPWAPELERRREGGLVKVLSTRRDFRSRRGSPSDLGPDAATDGTGPSLSRRRPPASRAGAPPSQLRSRPSPATPSACRSPGLPLSRSPCLPVSRSPCLLASPLRRQTKAHGPHGEEPRPDRRARHERPSDRHRVTFRGHELDGSAASKTTCSPRAATTRSTPRARAHAARASTEHLTPWRLLPGGARLSDSARFDLESVEGRARLPAE